MGNEHKWLVVGLLVTTGLATSSIRASALQTAVSAPCASKEYRQFDFWVGKWKVEWSMGAEKHGVGGNVVTREYNGCAVVEHYTDETTAFAGSSLLAWNMYARTWQQGWADNMGGAFRATGGVDASAPGRLVMTVDTGTGSPLLFRIVFEDIQANSFTWRYQSKKVGADAWTDMTVSKYTRAG